jgi:DNA-binding transcriptional MocR family regulator
LTLVTEELVRPGDVVVVEDVTYVGALDAARRVGARLVAVPTGADGVDVGALEAAIERHHPALVYLGPTHHSPTGSVLPDAARARIVAAAARARAHVVDDRTLADLAFDATPRPRPLGTFDLGAPVVTIGSLSKSVWAGLRVGWVRADPALVARLVQRRMVHDLGGDLVGQRVALGLLDDVPRLAGRRAATLAVRHRHLAAALAARLPEWEVAPARGGMSAWVRLPAGRATAFARTAATNGVHVVPGPMLSPHGGHDDHLRLSLTQSEAVLDAAVERLAAAWAADARGAW